MSSDRTPGKQPSGDAAIHVESLRVVRGGRLALDDVSLTLPAGRVVGLLGPSGSGKSTLIRAVVGVQIVESGVALVLGLPAGSPELRPRIGYMTQAPSVYADLTVRENLRYFGRVLGVREGRVDEVIATVALNAEADRVVARLSGGQQTRASLAAALIGAPDVVVLDEPTVGLDPVLRRDLWRTFRALAADGTTVLVSSHVMEEAAHCDELLLLREGKLLATGSVAEILARTGAPNLDEAFVRLIEETA